MHVTVTSSFGHISTTRSNYASTQLLCATGESDSKHGSYDMKRIAAISWELFIFGINFCRLFAKILCARHLCIFNINSGHLINESHMKKEKRGNVFLPQKKQNCNGSKCMDQMNLQERDNKL